MASTSETLNQALENSSIVDQVIERITQSIIKGELKPGDKLPTEYELVDSLHVGRNSIREAIKVLTHFRILNIVRSKGTFVADSFQGQMFDPILIGLILKQDNFTDLLELRQLFDSGIISLIIRKDKPDSYKAIDGALEDLHVALNKAHRTPEDILQKDCLFHQALGNLLCNPLVTQIANYIDRITMPSRTKTMKMILDQNEEEKFFNLHLSTVNVIKEKCVDKVFETVYEHYQYWRKS